jgi:hypothetical protein
MSHVTIVDTRLKQLDHDMNLEEGRLPGWKRFIRRYMSGRSFLVFFLAKYYGVAVGVMSGPAIKASVGAFLVKAPAIVVAWEYATALLEGAVAVWHAA